MFSKFDFRLKTEEYKFLEIVGTKQEKIMRLHTPLVCSHVALGFEKCMSDWLTLYHSKGTFINNVPRFLAIFDLPTLSYSITSLFWAILDPPTYPNMGRH